MDLGRVPAARCLALLLAAGRRDRQVTLEIGREVGVDLTTTSDLDDLRRVPLHGYLPLGFYRSDHEVGLSSRQIDFS